MGLGLYRGESRFRDEVDRCADALAPHLGLDVRDVLFPRDQPDIKAGARIEETEIAQPALFVIEYALARLLMSRGVIPSTLVGHSLGEYVAACLAGVFSLDDALALVTARGRIMQATASGAMLSIAASEAEILPLLSSELAVAAINTVASTVVAGPAGAIDELVSRLDHLGVSHTRLRTSRAFHSSLMDPAVPELARQVVRYRCSPPRLRFVSNVTGTWITPEQAMDPDYWARHLRATVRFADGLSAVLAQPTQILLELGPGHALNSFVRKHPAYRPGHRVVSVLGALRNEDVSTIAPLVEDLGLSQEPGPATPALPPSGLLVELQRGDAAERPLFLVHPAGGTLFHYKALAHHLDLRLPIYGLRASGVEPGEVIDGDVESMAGRYVEALRARQPSGPYLLGGWSFGGMVAYEMAIQLRRDGEDVTRVFMIDTAGPDQMSTELASGPGITDLDRLAPAMFRAVLLPRADEAALLSAVMPDDRAFLRLFQASLTAMARYQPSPYSGHVVFLRAVERQSGNLSLPEQAWIPLVEGELELVDVPGSHFTMMIPPHVETLARQMRRSLTHARHR